MKPHRSYAVVAAALVLLSLAPRKAGAGEGADLPSASGWPTRARVPSEPTPNFIDVGWELPGDPLPPADSPLSAIHRLALSYASGLLTSYAQVLPADFRFVFGDADLQRRYPGGFTREDELASADHLFHGFVDPAGVRWPAAESIQLDLGDLTVGADPEKPDSAAWYQVVTSPAVSLLITFPDGVTQQATQGAHEFHVVRGDAARLRAGQSADADHWYVWLWIEKGDPAAPVARGSRLASPLPAAAPPVTPPAPPTVLAVLRHPNPAIWPLTLELSLPVRAAAEIGILDVAGRMMARRELEASAPGVRRINLGDSVRLAPGVYWIRIAQGNRVASSRLVVIR